MIEAGQISIKRAEYNHGAAGATLDEHTLPWGEGCRVYVQRDPRKEIVISHFVFGGAALYSYM